MHHQPLEDLKSTLLDITQSYDHKLKFIKDELESGRYTINHDQIAHQLLAHTKIKIPEIA